jgi:eukaryotic-like serine/threonine-protein kinase
MTPGTTIGHYNILRPLGKGGMGEVYLAHDTKLDRDVAVKVLPESLRNDPERLARFRREAKAAASLQHSNIGTIHALEEIDDSLFIVMEYVDGQTLAEAIPEGGMDLDAFFATFIPLADALAHAHDQGRVHRDIKPGNIMIAKDGTPKILDFGLARIMPVEESSAPDTEAPTKTMKPAEPDPSAMHDGPRIMGTPQYMSPEQAEGRELDHRTDIFSFGVVMYEALRGRRPFGGETYASVISSILKDEPTAITEFKGDLSRDLWRVIRHSLEKDRRRRTQSMSEIQRDLEEVQAEVASGLVATEIVPGSPSVPTAGSWWSQRVVLAVGIILALTLGFIAAWILKPVPERPLRKFDFAVTPFEGGLYNGPALSPDGTMIAYSENGQLWIRNLDQTTPRLLPGTEGAVRPFWSPESDFVGYFVQRDGIVALRKMAVQGGSSLLLTEVTGTLARGAAWHPDGILVFGINQDGRSDSSSVLYRVSAQGDDPEAFATADSSLGHQGLIYPSLLPDGFTFLYAAVGSEPGGDLVVQRGEARYVVWEDSVSRLAFPVYSPTGHIVFQRGFPQSQGVWALAFDTKALSARGDPFPVASNGRYPTVSTDGTLVYAMGQGDSPNQLVSLDRQGQVTRVDVPRGGLMSPSISPEGQLVAFAASSQGNWDIWLFNLERGTSRRLTSGPQWESWPVWSPDGRGLAFQMFGRGGGGIFWRAADGSGDVHRLVGVRDGFTVPLSWSDDGRHLLYQTVESAPPDLWSVALKGEAPPLAAGRPVPFTQTDFAESGGRFSPDGRYVAYHTNESGQHEVYIKSFEEAASQWQVYVGRGLSPRWRGDGEELYYVAGGTLLAVSLRVAGNAIEPGTPETLFTVPDGVNLVNFDVTPNGRQFWATQQAGSVGETTDTLIMVVQNWYSEFKDRE